MSGCMSAFSGMPPAELSAGLAQLKEEHSPLREKLAGLLLLTEQIETDAEVEKIFTALKSSVAIFKSELDIHSEREEEVLFPMMGEYIGTSSGPVAVMEYEHEQAKALIGDFLRKTNNGQFSIEEMKNAAGLIKNAHDILSDHFTKEENVLFPMAERMLSDEEKAELHRKIQEIK
nr:hemerythrin domain-containing protein [Bacillus sp. EB600]